MSGFSIDVSAPAGQVGVALGTTFERYRTTSGTTGYLARQTPLVPAALAGGEISAILGLNTLSQYRPQASLVSPSTTGLKAHGTFQSDADGLTACSGAAAWAADGYDTLDQVGADYGVGSLLSAGLNGKGQTIAVYELATHSSEDVGAYESCFGLHNPVSTVSVDGGGAPGVGSFEADLDIEQVATQAPDASIISYEAPNTETGALKAWEAIVDQDKAKVISTSWGECEPEASDDGSLTSLDPLFEQAAMQGQTVLAATGDSGAEDCFLDTSLDLTTRQNAEVDYPASDKWVTGIGGTSLYPAGGESVWNDCGAQPSTVCAGTEPDGAGGGGLSRYEGAVAYQPHVLSWSSHNPCGTECREVPDLAANAGTPMVIYSGGSWGAGVGTSFAAPLVAGIIADANTGCARVAGGFNPALYALAAEGVYGSALNQITSGSNDITGTDGGNYDAARGYNLATGLGSPIASGLACPDITSVVPSQAPAGTTVTVRGVGLEKASFAFGATAATVLSQSATEAKVVVPPGAGTKTVAASSVLGRGTLTSDFTYGTLLASCRTARGAALGSAVGIASVRVASCPGYYVVDEAGHVAAFGAALGHGDLTGTHLNAPIIAITATPDGGGYWLLAADGGVFAFGDAHFYGSTGSFHLNAPVVGMAVTPDGKGYWIVAKDGGVFTFGDAAFHGSTGGLRLNDPIDGIAVAPGGNGYWLVASDGGVFTFTSDGFYGSLGSTRLNKPIIGMSSTPDGKGYTLVASDGGVFTFGDSPFYGSLGAQPPPTPVVDLAPTPADNGYYVIDGSGTVYAFGPGASYLGSV